MHVVKEPGTHIEQIMETGADIFRIPFVRAHEVCMQVKNQVQTLNKLRKQVQIFYESYLSE